VSGSGQVQVVATNRKARHEYHLEQTLEAGLALTGSEVKALRAGMASLADGWVSFDGGEAWLEGVHIPEYVSGSWTNHAPRRKRKLLLHRDQLRKWRAKASETGMTVVPLKLYFSGGRAKVEIALGRGKREWDKRQALKARQDELEARRAIRTRSLG
jgi:SsrA-binding protein